MNPYRLVLLIVAGCCLIANQSLRAQAAAPFTPDKQYSADEIVVTKEGMQITSKVYMDNGKIRSEMNANGMSVIAILLSDQKKMYSVMPAQKMVMEMALDPQRAKQYQNATGDGATFDTVGPDTVDGAACTKYKMTSKDNKVFYWWINAATKAPVKMTADDGSFTLTWKNYKAGPQDPSLFVPPADYQVMQMPTGLSVPGGAPGGGAPPSGQ
jgi:hypothetical protein